MNHPLFALSLAAALSAPSMPARQSIDLGGRWERWIGDKLHDEITVPSSYRPIGTVVLRRQVELQPPAGRRAVLSFEAIAHQARVRWNGSDVGTMGPWTPYDFDVTDKLSPGMNRIEVEITDWQVPLGPIGAWEAYGGIIRPARVEFRPDPYIDNVRLRYKLDAARDAASCSLDVFVRAEASAEGRIHVQLLRGPRIVSEASTNAPLPRGPATVSLSWDVKSPDLWSPETPSLYTLRVRLSTSRGEDVYTTEAGFRELKIDGNKFYLNGELLTLRGVCRHDIWKDQGHTMSEEQIEQDLRMIKAMGANFVRLVHYPHNKRVVDAAARIGLLVTEESGLVWLNFRNIPRDTLETGLGNLERTIRRDWNNPALFAVLLANESAPTLEAIQEGRRRVRALVPELFMSSARIDSPDGKLESSKRLFDEGGLDFYTDHTYGYDMRMFERSVAGYSGKPVVFTEWGGRSIGQSPPLMKEVTDRIGELVEQGRLAGHSFWSWADLPEFSRQDTEMEDGILKSGVVTEERAVRPDVYLALMNLFRRTPRAATEPSREPELLRPLTYPLSANSEFTPISLQAALDDPAQARAWTEMEGLLQEFFKRQGFTGRHWEEAGGRFWLWNAPQFRLGSIPFATPLQAGATQPVLISPARPRVEIPLGVTAARLHFLGNVTLPDGYPVIGRLGARVGRYIITYADGDRQEVPLRWGQEVARSNLISVASRLEPTAAYAERVIRYVKSPIREIHQALLLPVTVKSKHIASVVCELDPAGDLGTPPPGSMHHSAEVQLGIKDQVLLLFAITAEK